MDAESFKRMFLPCHAKLYGVAYRLLENASDAEDVLQDGFITLFNQLGNFEGRGSFEGWVRRIFVTTALMHLRKKDPLKISDDITGIRFIDNGDTSAIEKMSHKELLELVSGLPSGFRIVFNLYVIEGYSHKEIGEMLGISENTSRSQLSRARLWLQDKIRKTGK